MKLPMRGKSHRAANDGMTLTRSARGLARSLTSRMASERSVSAARTRTARRSPSSVNLYAPTRALDQTHAKIGFERLELMADRAVGDVQSLGGAGKAAGAGCGFERAQRRHRRQMGSHCASSYC